MKTVLPLLRLLLSINLIGVLHLQIIGKENKQVNRRKLDRCMVKILLIEFGRESPSDCRWMYHASLSSLRINSILLLINLFLLDFS